MKYIFLLFLVTNLFAEDNNDFNTLLNNYKQSLIISNDINKIVQIKENKVKEVKKTKAKAKKIKALFIIKNTFQNLRIDSSNNSTILNVLSKGMKVEVLKKLYKNDDLWLKVKYINKKNKPVIGYLYQGKKY